MDSGAPVTQGRQRAAVRNADGCADEAARPGLCLQRVISGGQTGVDRAALDAALASGLPIGGWCPKGRRAEDGIIDVRYPLIETPSDQYAQRTRWNVRDADATLIITSGPLTGGTELTARHAETLGRPVRIVDLAGRDAGSEEVDVVRAWLAALTIETLNVAGPRESTCPGIEARARRLLSDVFAA